MDTEERFFHGLKVNYPQTIIEKSEGFTESEAYLSYLCENTFLSLWSYPNLFRDQGRTNSSRLEGKGDGKELCDLLVVFGDHVIIFSDKQCAFTDSKNIQVDWSRWYKRAVRAAANQIWGAERWIKNHADSIYLDKDCKVLFPLEFPSNEKMKLHRIVVAHGVSKICKKHIGGSGSLLITPNVLSDMHICKEDHDCMPFCIGQVDETKGYVHVLDDTSLKIIMETVDTISDFIQYLTKKEDLIQSGKLMTASGEDDLLAYYLQQTDENGEHTFILEKYDPINSLVISEGIWDDFSRHPSRIAQVEANEISYFWDALIEKFIYHIKTGTSYAMSHPNIKNLEETLRFLAKENRTRRRFLAKSLLNFVHKIPSDFRGTRMLPPSNHGDPYYLFFLFPRPKGISDEKYRGKRAELLECYLLTLKFRHPDAMDIIGIATETGRFEEGSEDCMYIDARNWTDAENKMAEDIEKKLISRGLLNQRKIYRSVTKEYPDDLPEKVIDGMRGHERNTPCPCNSGKKFKKCCGRG